MDESEVTEALEHALSLLREIAQVADDLGQQEAIEAVVRSLETVMTDRFDLCV